MSDGLTFDVVGNRVIADNLDQFEAEAVARIYEAMGSAAEVGKEVAKSLARVDTGEMRDGVEAEVRDDQIIISDAVPWSIFNELGFHHYGSGTWVPPQPFLVPGGLAAGDELKKQLGGNLF